MVYDTLEKMVLQVKKMPFFNSWNKSDELPPTKPEQPLLPPIPSGGGWSEEEKYLHSGVTSETQPSFYLGIMYLWIFSLKIFPSTGEKKPLSFYATCFLGLWIKAWCKFSPGWSRAASEAGCSTAEGRKSGTPGTGLPPTAQPERIKGASGFVSDISNPMK